MTRPIHFEIVSDDAERTKKFYEDVFDWKIEKWKGPIDYWLITTGSEDETGIDGAFGMRQNSDDSTVNTIDVPDLDVFIDKVTENGGTIVRPKTAVPGVGWMAYFRDTEGNIWGLMQNDPNAK